MRGPVSKHPPQGFAHTVLYAKGVLHDPQSHADADFSGAEQCVLLDQRLWKLPGGYPRAASQDPLDPPLQSSLHRLRLSPQAAAVKLRGALHLFSVASPAFDGFASGSSRTSMSESVSVC